ncbi:hypothetical protein [Maribacter sp. ACAM166]|uniref:hypothetical protein n=1 Tax=Maribacter sp. ACAM166 TaxID=2508996 RepID=UPI0010FCECBD|nr:hypothetical protein [Maribacter sp. ACAM166]TLP80173.1 hypothetical protein ES765_09350 [Maribacter sp. ACAM166]
MDTGKKIQDNDKLFGRAEKDVPKSGGLSQDDHDRESIGNLKDVIGKPVNNGGVATSKSDLQLELQWLEVRDEYLSHYPDVQDADFEYGKGSFSVIIESIAKRRQRTSKEIRDEIMEWSSTK